MLRWLIVCALLAQTLALTRPSRHASWPNWMKMPKMEWPDWMRMPTQEDLPEITIPEIPEIPDIQIPEPWNPFQRSTGNGGQTVQFSPGNGWGQGYGRWPSGQRDRGAQHRSSNWDWDWPTQDRNGETNSRRPDGDQQQTRQEQQQRPSNGRGSRPETPRTDRSRPSQTDSRGTSTKTRKLPGQDCQPTWQNIDTQASSSNGRGNQERPSQTKRPNKQRKARPQTLEGPPQRQEAARVKSRKRPSQDRVATRQRTEPSVNQQVEEFRLGMPRWLRVELNDTFTTMKEELNKGRLRMNSWAEDISDAADDWWNRWTGRGNSQSRRPSRPSSTTHGETTGRQHPSSNRDRTNGRHEGRHGDGTSWTPGRQNNRGRGHEHSRRGHGHSTGRGQGHSTGRGQGHSTGRGQGHSNGRGHGHSNGRGNTESRTWYEESGRKHNFTCRRPFRPTFDEPSREEPSYEVICGGNDYEARLYNSSVWVSVNVYALTYDLAMHKAYMKLYRYINGHNSQGVEVTRTVPISTRINPDSQSNRWFEQHNYTVSFYLPKEFQANPPIPNDPEMFIVYVEPTVVYAHTFRGYAWEFNIWEYLDELSNTLDVSQETYLADAFFINVYDAPWKFFNRRNDILIAMDTGIKETPACAPPATESPLTTLEEITTTVGTVTEKTTIAATTNIQTQTTETLTTRPPTVIGEIPAEINLPDVKNPFENNDLEQEEGFDCEEGSECPRYETAIRYDGYEQRHYAYSRWICLDQAACDFDSAQWLTQGPLLEYFYPKGNREQTTMNPTTPIVIGMDASDLKRTACDKMYTTCMFIPEEHQGAPPTPRDARLYLNDIPAMSRYVEPFGGFASSHNVPKLGVEFLTKLQESGLPYDASIVAVAQYTTSKLAKKRLNELWVMDQSLLQGELNTE